MSEYIAVEIRWNDGYLETFPMCTEVRCGAYLIFMRLWGGQNRHIPLWQVRWYSVTPESHGALGWEDKAEQKGTPDAER